VDDDEGDNGCDCQDLLPGEGNENWHSVPPRDGLDLFREFFGGGLDGWFRTVVPPGSFDSNRGFGGAEGEDGQGPMPIPRHGSIRDAMLKKPIIGDDQDYSASPTPNDSHPRESNDTFASPPILNPTQPPIQRDDSIDFKSDDEKRREIERILSDSPSSPHSRDGLLRRSSPLSPLPPPPPHSRDSDLVPFQSSPWSSLFPRRFWDGWFSGLESDNGKDSDTDERFNRREDDALAQRRSGWSGSFGGANFSFGSSFTSTSTSRTVKPDGTEETKKTVRDGNGVTETTTRRKGSRSGTLTRMVDRNGEETITTSGDQSLF